VGLATLAAARATYGALRVAITDLKAHNLDVARRLGADERLAISAGDSPATTAARICAALGGAPEVVVDACGFQSSLDTAVAACATGGRVVMVGLGSPRCSLDLSDIVTREVDVLGSFRYAHWCA
jgi:L-iditol 2-dehydrogenase